MTQQRADYPLDYTKGPANGRQDRLNDLADTATDRLKNAADNVQETAANIAAQAREYGEKAQDAARNFKPFVEKSMKDQPMATLAVAAAAAFVLGALWKR